MEKKKVLVVVDMQNDFVTGSLENENAKAIVDNVVDYVKNFDGDIIFTRDTHEFGRYLDTQEGKKLPIEHCIKGTNGWEIIPELKPYISNGLDKDKPITFIFDKNTFGSLILAQHIFIQYHDYDTEVYFVGVCTGICVISNVALVKALNPEVPIKVVENCCACVTKESHNIAIEAMKTMQVEIV